MRFFVTVIFMLAANAVHSAVFQTTFTLAGVGGESGSGSFTWSDDPDPGAELDINEISALSITISGGAVVGGSVTFGIADCSFFAALPRPAFTTSINFVCDNTVNATNPSGTNIVELNSASLITISAPVTVELAPESVPSTPMWALALLMALMTGVGLHFRRLALTPV
jgi:hypothetical protein